MTSPFVVTDQNSSNFRFSAEMAEKRTALFGHGSEESSGQHGSRSPAGVCVFSICTAVRAERPKSKSSASLG